MKEKIYGNDTPSDQIEEPDSPARRKVLKKAVYVAPVLVTLGVLTPINSAFAGLSDVPCPPGTPPEQC